MVLIIAILLFSIVLSSNVYSSSGSQTNLLSPSSSSSQGFPTDPRGSWNPNVKCASPRIVKITDITDNMTGYASYNASLFSPGLTSPLGFEEAKRWLTSGGNTPPGWMPPGPQCTIKNFKRQTVALFVEIDGVC